jgi:dihydrofolate reductase
LKLTAIYGSSQVTWKGVTMRRVLYRVAASLDGFIAGPNGEIDWIVPDPTLDFASLYAGFDTVLLGRRTYEMTLQPGAPPWPAGWRIYVFSQTLDAAQHAGVTVVSGNPGATVTALRSEPGRNIWLFGGGSLFASLLAAHVVDQIEVAVMPVLLGAGTPLVSAGAHRSGLILTRSNTSPNGIVNLQYQIQRAAG